MTPETGLTINTDEIKVNAVPEDSTTVTLSQSEEITVSTGDSGLRGTPGLVWRGNFNVSKNYYQGDAVSHNGSSYIATAYTAASTTRPDSSATFTLIAGKGNDGTGYYAVEDGGLSQNNFTNADHNKLDNIETQAQKTNSTNINAGGGLLRSGGEMTGNLTLESGADIVMGNADQLRVEVNNAKPFITANAQKLTIEGDANISLRDSATDKDFIFMNSADLNVQLNYNGNERLETNVDGVDVNGDITLNGTVDGRDVAADGTKLDTIDLDNLVRTDAVNNTAVAEFGSNSGTLYRDGIMAKFGTSELASIKHGGTNFFLDNTEGNLNITNSDTTGGSDVVINNVSPNGVFSVSLDDGTATQTQAKFIEADADTGRVYLHFNGTEVLRTIGAGVKVFGDLQITGTVDGRDVSVDGTKLDGIEANADVTDATNVANAGAFMTTVLGAWTITETSGGELLFKKTGGPGEKMKLDASGNLFIKGTITENATW